MYIDGLYHFFQKKNPMTLEQIEEQIRRARPDLLKPKSAKDKVVYQLYFLFEYGNAQDFISLYEMNPDVYFFDTHFRAAIVYAFLDQISLGQNAMERYFKRAFGHRPLEPFLHSSLTSIMTEDFSKKMLLQFQ